MTFDDYREIDAINWSRLKALRVSPLRYRHERMAPPAEAPHLRIGLAMHCLVLEGEEEFARRYVCYPGRRQGGAWEDFRAEHGDKTILNSPEYLRACGAAASLLAHPAARTYLAAGLKEATITWTDEATGLGCKGRVDHCGSHLVDIKSTATIIPRQFCAAAARLGYHAQLAFYLDGLRSNGVDVADGPVLIAVESDEPHDIVVYHLPDDVVEAGRAEYRRLLELLVECQESDTWPGVAPDELELELPAWATMQEALELDIDGEVLRV